MKRLFAATVIGTVSALPKLAGAGLFCRPRTFCDHFQWITNQFRIAQDSSAEDPKFSRAVIMEGPSGNVHEENSHSSGIDGPELRRPSTYGKFGASLW